MDIPRPSDEPEDLKWPCVRCGHVNRPKRMRGGRLMLDKEGNPMLPSKCEECGVGRKRKVRRHRRRSKIGGKRGRNSGKVKAHGKKKGGG